MNMYALAGWTEVDCQEADRVRGSQPVTVLAGRTKLDVDDGVIYREWGDDSGNPILRDYLWSPATPAAMCTHFVPEGGAA